MGVNLDTGNVYITNEPYANITGDTLTGSPTYKVVRIDQAKFDDILTKKLIEQNIPVTPKVIADDAQAAQSFIIDLKQIKQTLAIQGELVSDSDSKAIIKKRDLMVLAGYGGVTESSLVSAQSKIGGNVTVIWGLSAEGTQQKVNANIQQVQFTETTGGYTDGTVDKQRVKFDVQIKLSVGKERRLRSA